jgi:hypothetical protein
MGKPKLTNCGGRFFLFVKYYGVGILLSFRKVIFKPEAGSGNYIPPALYPVLFTGHYA